MLPSMLCSRQRATLAFCLVLILSLVYLLYLSNFSWFSAAGIEDDTDSFAKSVDKSHEETMTIKSGNFTEKNDSRNITDFDETKIVSGSSDSILEEETGSVMYRNAWWKAEVGQWLNHCHESASAVPITETIYYNACEKDCSSQGVCNHELSVCRCFHGYTGDGCDKRQDFECNNEPTNEFPFGVWRVSICPSFCDKSRAMCFCGSGYKYPDRPVAESCGFVINNDQVDWSKPDFETIYSNGSISTGWCNLSPDDYLSKKIKPKQHCDCKYDCNWGILCDIPTECVCINQCSGNGICRGGFCKCDSLWYGIDCSIPTTQLSPLKWPNWLRPAVIDIPNGETTFNLKATIEKRRPLIYVYDLPPEFNNLLLEGRRYKFQCVNRVYDERNATFWSDQLYGAEVALYESLLSSSHRTMNGDEADFFYVPVLGACAITRADDTLHLTIQHHMGLRGYFSGDMYKLAYKHIRKNFPFWNRFNGHDHIWSFFWDEGACSAPKEIWNSTMVVHWGNTNSRHKNSTTAYFGDNWDPIPKEWRGDHPCYEPQKDIVIPVWKAPDESLIERKLWARPREDRKTLFYFNGNLGAAYEFGRPEPRYSMGIRQKLAVEFSSVPNLEGKMGKQAAPDVIVVNKRSSDYGLELSQARFCGVLPGDGWSGRMEDSVLHGCIPVIIQDGIHLPFENMLDYNKFAVRIVEDDIPRLISNLRNISESEVDAKLKAVQGLWQRFLYRDSIMLEAKRQQQLHSYKEEWARQHGALSDDDVFATFIQVLHFKLHNDVWRKSQKQKKNWGMTARCNVQ